MSRRHRRTRCTAATLATVMLVGAGLPGVAAARPAGEGLGPRAEQFVNPEAAQAVANPPASKAADPTNERFAAPAAEPSTPAPTVIRTVVKEEAVRVLPIALAGAALLIAIAGMGYVLMRVAPRQRLGGQH